MIEYSKISGVSSREELETFINRFYEGDRGIFVSELNKTVSRLLHVDLKKAAEVVAKAAELFSFLPEEYRARLWTIEARYDNWCGNPQSALKKYRRAIKEMLAQRQFELAARTRQGLMDVEMYLGKYAEALKTGRKALAYFKRKNNLNLAARVMTNIGNIYHRLDKNHMAIRYYDRAREIFSKEGGIPLAIVDYNRANIFANMGEIEKAEKLYHETSKIYREAGIAINAVKTDYSLAYLYFLTDRYTLALKAFEKVHQDFMNLGDEKSAAAALLDMAEINIYLHQYSSSIALSEKVIPLYRKFKQPYEEGKAHYFAAQSLSNLGDHKDARKYLNNADRLFRSEDNRLWQGMVYYLRSRIDLDKKRIMSAIRSARRAKEFFAGSGDERRGIDSELALLEAELKADNGGLKRAKKIKDRAHLGYQRYSFLRIMGEYHLQSKDYERASQQFQAAIEIVENMLLSLYPDEIRFFFALGKQEAYLRLVESLLKMGRVEESFFENSRALSIINQKIPAVRIDKKKISERDLKTRDQLRARLKELGRMPKSGERQIDSTPVMKRAEQELWHTERKIRSIIYPSEISDNHAALTQKYCHDYLADDELLVNYVAIGENLGTFRVQKNKVEYIPLGTSRTQMTSMISEFQFLMEKSVYSASESRSLMQIIENYQKKIYEILIKPIDPGMNARKLIFMIDGFFAQIPYWALMDSEDIPLFQKFNLRLLSNPADLKDRNSVLRYKNGLSDAIFIPDNSGLPMINAEGKKIKTYFQDAEFFEGGEAACSKLLEVLGRTEGFVHIATHASRSSENPLFSRIIMSDGPLFPFDLFGARISSTLVTLSGCQTAAPGVFYGNSFSLAKAFYQAGARHVLASLWPISDKISMVFMDEFYGGLRKSEDIFRAYRQAMEKTRKLNLNPAFWSSFVLLGI
ncbi:MAG: CHAT domain-containing protein [candidate division Zixibacteria bacterium]|nr:CHAT domain-containing protein [candidate division Zixibacteria bacterium]NIR68149.1 CHAT domain-containing protein [candidate division Zixibacteria bacterium]NIS17825.1 CHAT domain-containing protein [candidate division Zixibacteria bacterium]NIS49364.1 CHAT domain-containing protein [candidate division Zixibacteria bacterium]NIT54143.1 CHAT domain-containing protein [candidate division Zixibacteria bacterium]